MRFTFFATLNSFLQEAVMDNKKITRRLFFALTALTVSDMVNARGGGHGSGRSWGRGGRSSGSGSLGFVGVVLIAGAAWWALAAIFGRKKDQGPQVSPPKPIYPLEIQPPARSVPETSAEDGAQLKLCPRCGKSMAQRVAKKGRYAGRVFLGCTGYPRCLGTRPTSKLP